MRLEQAIFTSARSERLEGYQLAAASSGIDEKLARELSTWGPAHDSLWSNTVGATSINFHPLTENLFCLSRTTLAGAEYSGRSGGRVYTQMLLVSAEALDAFANDPLLILRAVASSGRLLVHDQLPASLPTIPLLGRGGDIPPEWTAEIVDQVGAESLAELAAVASSMSVSVVTNQPAERLLQVLLHQLSPAERLTVSFTTGLRPSSRRPFKLSFVPDDPQLARQSQRMNGGRVIEVFAGAVA